MYPKAKKFSVVLILLVLGLPLFCWVTKYGLAYVGGADLCEGDRLETRTCRQCGGSGKDQDMADTMPGNGDRCPFCRGKGKVEVVIPGPKRPTRLWGVVVDLQRATNDLTGDLSRPRNLRSLPNPFGDGAAMPGAIGTATVTFRRLGGEGAAAEEPETVKVLPSGRFSRKLVPGSYRIKASAPGFTPVTVEYEVESLTEPIWLEKATLIQEPSGAAEARSVYGLECVAALDRAGGDGGTIRILPGEP